MTLKSSKKSKLTKAPLQWGCESFLELQVRTQKLLNYRHHFFNPAIFFLHPLLHSCFLFRLHLLPTHKSSSKKNKKNLQYSIHSTFLTVNRFAGIGSAGYSVYSTFLTTSPGSILFSRSTLLKKEGSLLLVPQSRP